MNEHEWVYVDTFTHSVVVAPPPGDLVRLPREAIDLLTTQWILCPSDTDVREEVLARIELLRKTLLYLEVANTHRCNLACAPCYRLAPDVDRTLDMQPETADRLVDWVENRLEGGAYRELTVDFLGGEPLLAADCLYHLVIRLNSAAKSHGVAFECTVVTNTTRLGRTEAAALREAGATGVQVTFEGPRRVHDLRRGVSAGEPGSYHAQVRLLQELRGVLKVTVRVNFDRQNLASLPELFRALNELAEEGCFRREDLFISPVAKTFPVSPHPHLDRYAFTPQESAEAMEFILRERLEAGLGVGDADLVPEYPCRFYVCDGYSIDAAGRFFVCGSLFGSDLHYADLVSPPSRPAWKRTDLSKRCLGCVYLPSCLGGCPMLGPLSEAGLHFCPAPYIDTYLRTVALTLARCSPADPPRAGNRSTRGG
ncbi:MAG TPA: hypothetical protein DHW14_04275 [Clostridiales bacterium]|nr:hypothetical protein [Clostridiales bacterium]